MAAKPETTFTQAVHRHLPPANDLHREKMYNPMRGGGFDVWYSGLKDLWIEYKFLTLPKRDTTQILPSLSELQRIWGRRRHAEGRSVAVIVGCKEGGVILEDLAWEQEISTADFKKALRSRAEIAAWILNRTGIP